MLWHSSVGTACRRNGKGMCIIANARDMRLCRWRVTVNSVRLDVVMFQMLISRQTLRQVVVDMVVSFSSLPLGVERKALHPSSPAASSTTTAGTSEEEGLHACPLPHILGDYFCNVAEFSGGGGTGLPPHNVGEYFGGGGAGSPPHNASVYFGGGGTGSPPHNAGVYFGGGGTGPPPHNVGVYLMPMTEEETAGRQRRQSIRIDKVLVADTATSAWRVPGTKRWPGAGCFPPSPAGGCFGRRCILRGQKAEGWGVTPTAVSKGAEALLLARGRRSTGSGRGGGRIATRACVLQGSPEGRAAECRCGGTGSWGRKKMPRGVVVKHVLRAWPCEAASARWASRCLKPPSMFVTQTWGSLFTSTILCV